MKWKNWKKLLASALALACVVGPLGVMEHRVRAQESEKAEINEPPIIEEGEYIDWNNMEPGTSAQVPMRVNTPSKADIVRYFSSHSVFQEYNTSFDVQPSASVPYSLGKVSDGTLREALCALNAVRYVAGIGADVTLNEEYNELAQAASLVNAANGVMSHYPNHPNGMEDDLYRLGYRGASSSNLAYGYGPKGYWNFWDYIVRMWMNDGDSGNIDRVGHRRWALNPDMGQVGFGIVEVPDGYYTYTHTAMYAFDSSSIDSNYYGVAWPAHNMPVELFEDDFPWSISMGYAVDGNAVRVRVRDIDTQQEWNFYNGSPDGYFNVDNDYYGQPGCIIFKPNGISYNEGKKYEVVVSGLPEEFSYVVNFFSVANAYIGDVNTELQLFSYDESSHYLSGQIVVVEWVNGLSTVPRYVPKMEFVAVDGSESIEVFVTPTGTNTYYFDRLVAEGLTPGKEYVFKVTSTDPNNVGENITVPIYTGTSGIGSSGKLGSVKGQDIQFKTGLDGTLILYGTDPNAPYVGNVNSVLKQVQCTESDLGYFVSGEIIITEWIDGVSTVPRTTPIMTFESYNGTEVNEVFMKCLDGTNTYYFDRNLNEGLTEGTEYIFRIQLTEQNNVSELKTMVATTNEMDEKEGVLWETNSQIVMFKTVPADGDYQLRVYGINK